MNIARNTENKSFLKMWRYLQKEGIENNIFMLDTKDKTLMNFSTDKYLEMDREDPTFEIYHRKIIIEAQENIWFYFRELMVMEYIDENGIKSYTKFQLDPVSMMMIYLYDKNKSFVLIDNKEKYLVVLGLLWNYHKSLYSTEYLVSSSKPELDEIVRDTTELITNMPIKVLLGSSQAIDKSRIDHILVLSEESINHTYISKQISGIRKDTLINTIIDQSFKSMKESFVTNISSKDKHFPAFFSLNVKENCLVYSYLLGLLDNDCTLYLSGFRKGFDESKQNIFYKMLSNCTPMASNQIYDTKQLEKNYIIDWKLFNEK